ncbi:alkaline phosphatase [Pseudoxanthomonas yeongjuensis]|uniref:alkaline phosphatase n=1 Tax=Pseudoxanthomonas yeongjuensis TaxID=377616 RepID=UPI00139151BF|nr:alkaline phosphatase [Pseudoxanthomonas yeongjuensis]KAF1714456.1 alkaline phosphatase [Pseudoxanthomonas yeongjuensis]
MRRLSPVLTSLALTLLSSCAATPVRRAESAVHTIEVPAVAHPAGETPAWWYRSGAARAAGNGAMQGRAKNVILFLGDGMSLTTVAAARILEGQRKGSPGEENQLSWETFPSTALSKTYNTDSQTPDSAGTMTAITTGVKSHMGAIGVASGRKDDCATSLEQPLLSWLELADSAGLATGVVTTARLTHATPAATYAHAPNRNWENDTDLPAEARAQGCKDIAQQLLSSSRFGRGPSVALGGGRGEYTTVGQRDPEYDDKVGQRLDGRDLVGEWQRAHPDGAYVWNTRQFQAAKEAPAILGLFEPDHMQFDHDRNRSPEGEPSLSEMTVAAIRTLSKNAEGYVLMVEGGRIDHANHNGNAFRALDETISLSDAVRAARAATSADDTLIIVTADHSHVLNFVGYPVRGNPILGKVRGMGGEDDVPGDLARDGAGQVFTTLTYANGPGNTGASNQQPAGPKSYPHAPSSYEPREGRPDLSNVDTADPDYLQESLVPLKSESHGGEDVGIWASGPGSAAVRGTVEENTIYHFIVQATPKLRERLCAANTCNADGVPVELPRPADFEKK